MCDKDCKIIPGLSLVPFIVNVFPEEVYPYAKIHTAEIGRMAKNHLKLEFIIDTLITILAFEASVDILNANFLEDFRRGFELIEHFL